LDYKAASSIKSKEEIFLKTTCYTTYRIFLIAMILYVFAFGTPLSAFAKPLQVAIVPFKVNAEKDLSFLKDGIVDMLSSRLYWEDKINIINRQTTEKAAAAVGGPLNEIKAKEMGTGLGADYVLFGSLTVFGNSVSIDAKMVDVSGKKKTLTFFNQSQGMDQVIPDINLFASDINEKVFARAMPSQKIPVTSQAPQAQTDVRAHPEKLVAGGFSESDTAYSQRTAPGQEFIPTKRANQSGQFWKSQDFKNLINGIALGDVDGDGKIETVVITPNEVQLYRFENNRLVKIKDKISESSYENLIGVDVADINGNGYAEIFVTSLNALKTNLNSFVLEYDGQNFKKIVNESHWYYRVVTLPERGKVLFGQRQEGISADPFAGAIFEMAWQDADYVPENKILPPKHANLMGFTYGNAMNTGQDVVVAYDKNDYIRIIQPSGERVWTSSDPYGGSTLNFILPKIEPDSENVMYFPMCIHITDFNADGKYEVIAAKNQDVAKRVLGRFRKFTTSQIEVLSWDGLGLSSVWETRKISGYIRDFEIGDFNNDGKAELVAAVIMKEGSIVTTTPKSSLIAYMLK
jgi:TolB-like protein